MTQTHNERRSPTTHPATDRAVIIQGGMGIGVSDWRLARAVSSEGQLGVVSGTAIDAVLVRRLQLGDGWAAVARACTRHVVR